MNETSPETIKLASLMQELGYRALVEENRVKTGMSGFNVVIFHWSGLSLQMYLGILLDDKAGFGFEEANAVNHSYRFLKCYIRQDAVSFEQDYLFDVSKQGAKEELERIIMNWESSIGTVIDVLRDARKRYGEHGEASTDSIVTQFGGPGQP